MSKEKNIKKKEYADTIPCYSCEDGYVLYEKNGSQCEECMNRICEGCCDNGEYDEDDAFCCKRCLDGEKGGLQGINKVEGPKRG